VGVALILHTTPNVELRINDDPYFENLLMNYKDSPLSMSVEKKDPTDDMIDIFSDK